jgi:N-carbamoyl-L-amino-acid hydrolase
VLGVLGPLEAFRALRLQGFVPRRSIELITFTAEEPTRFGLGCLGSRLMSGSLTPEKALALKDSAGKTLEQWLAEMNWPKAPLESVKLRKNYYRAFVELHIEQGPILEKEGLDLGIVEKIAAPSSFRVRFVGQGGHAGGVLMPGRRDALSGACELALEIERAALSSGCPDTVATTGVIKSEPNAINSIPFRVLMEVDLRDTDLVARTRTYDRIHAAAVEIAQRRNLEMTWEPINMDPPAISDPELVHSLQRHAEASEKKVRKMISRAYHDCLFMAQICPTTMLFIPCKGGMSHRPDEFSSKHQMAIGVEVLARALAEWSSLE